MIQVRISRDDEKRINDAFRNISKDSSKYLSRALNRTLTRSRNTIIPKFVVKDANLNVKRPRVKKALKIVRRASPSSFLIGGAIKAKGRNISAYQFGAKQFKKGVRVKFFRGGSRTLFEGAFIGKFPQGAKGQKAEKNLLVARRVDALRYGRKPIPGLAYGALPDKYRLKVRTFYGPSIPDILAASRNTQLLQQRIDDVLSTEINRAVDSLLRGF
jgi:hypothetical protein